MNRGVDGRDTFLDDQDRQYFLDSLSRICRESCAEVLAYCLMGNHFHLAIQVGPLPLSRITHRLLTGYVAAFNVRHDRAGHLYQARSRTKLCVDDAYLAVLIQYIHQNPVRAGFVAHAADWPWSSYHSNGAELAIPVDFDPWAATKNPVSISRFIDAPQLALEEIAMRVQTQTGITLMEMRSPIRRRSVIASRRALTHEAIRNGHPLNTIARLLQTSATSITRYSKTNTVITVRPAT